MKVCCCLQRKHRLFISPSAFLLAPRGHPPSEAGRSAALRLSTLSAHNPKRFENNDAFRRFDIVVRAPVDG